MRILYIDIDTLRPDHLGCYGYGRETSPNIDRIAAEGVRFENCYASDAPCLPSRSAMWRGRFGIHTGVVNHGGINADPRPTGRDRGFRNPPPLHGWTEALRAAGLDTVSVSPFADRHAAWWFYAGFNEMFNPGKIGRERADEVFPYARDWLDRNAERDNWFLHVNFWDPHTPYRTPAEFGNPFADCPPPSWITQEKIDKDYHGYGTYTAAHPPRPDPGCGGYASSLPSEIKDLAEYKRFFDGYDCGIRYADDYVGKILDVLDSKRALDDTVIIVSADHAENLGELNVYADHQTADHCTSRVPFILRWPGITTPRTDRGLHYQTDLAATVLELAGGGVPEIWDGRSFADAVREGREHSRESLVVSQCAWSCQRAVRFDNWMYLRTYDTGLKDFPEHMLFDVGNDPHELADLASERTDLVQRGEWILKEWCDDMMAGSAGASDPLWEVMREGGPYHTRYDVEHFARQHEESGHPEHAERMRRDRGKPAGTR